jgi:uncharacterized membrane protein
MKYRFVYFSGLFLLMLITGVFWGTWFTLTRSIEEFSAEEFVHIGKVIIANVALPMRIIMPAGILLMMASLWLFNRKKSPAYYLGWASLLSIIAVLLITLLVLVPIDNDIREWSALHLPQNWEATRDKWKTFHALRTFLSLISFGCFSLFVLAGRYEKTVNASSL